MPCRDLGHMPGVLHHLHRFLSKRALIPNGPISLQLTFISCILSAPHRLHRAFQSRDQTPFLHSPPVARSAGAPLTWAISCGRQAWRFLFWLPVRSAQARCYLPRAAAGRLLSSQGAPPWALKSGDGKQYGQRVGRFLSHHDCHSCVFS